jgi:hypothetical protein
LSHKTSQPHEPLASQPPQSDLAEVSRALAQRRRLMEEIRGFNPKAQPSFLGDFSTECLEDYLEHLRYARYKTVRLRGWLQLRSAALEEARRQLERRRAA